MVAAVAGQVLRALAIAALAAGSAAAAPARVVSMNVCTDQMALLVAAPGQLVSVSWLARDPATSALAADFGEVPANRGQAEEIFLLRPDLVLAGQYAGREAVALLRRLGVEVAEFAPETSLQDVRDNLRRMGALLGRAPQAEAVVARFDARLAEVPSPGAGRPRALTYAANSYTTGAGTLQDAVLTAAGYDNLAAGLGITGLAPLPLEALVMAHPDLIVEGTRYRPPSLAEALLDHPALAAVRADSLGTVVSDADWVCGGPFTAEAVVRLAAERAGLQGAAPNPRVPGTEPRRRHARRRTARPRRGDA